MHYNRFNATEVLHVHTAYSILYVLLRHVQCAHARVVSIIRGMCLVVSS